jgi:two-component system LytT family sensor kinase
MHAAFTNDLYVAGGLIGYSVGLVITILLVVLTLRASRLPGTAHANIQCALCALLWNFGGIAHTVVCALGLPKEGPPALLASALQFSGAAAWPIPMLAMLRPFAVFPWQRIGSRVLQVVALSSGALIIGGLSLGAAFHASFRHELILKELTSFNASVLLIAAAVLLLRGGMTSRTTRFASLTILLGVLGTSLGIVVEEAFRFPGNLGAALAVVSEQATLLIVLGAFFLFARFRFADVFIRYSLRIVLASFSAVLLILAIQSSFLWHMASHVKFSIAVHVFAASGLAAALLLSFVFLDRRSEMLINHWIFHAPDYRQAARQFGEKLTHLYIEAEIISEAESAIRIALDLGDVRLIRLDTLPATEWPAELTDGEVELGSPNPLRERLSLPNLELLVPVRSAGHVMGVLAISPGPARRGLVSQEVDYLRTVAAQLGSRLDSLRLDREAVERRSREALLLQQVTEAELRALRAQINPHFLFNSLNTIANLIVTNPSGAETMTLRLARVFRYVLAHSSQSLTSIHEEIEFLRTYLQIEEARFGDRLKVEIEVEPDAATEHIPSLILQPIVENALKHGLAPKLGPGCLWISARLQGNQVCLKVEDDGIGPVSVAFQKPNGDGSPSQDNDHRVSGGVGLRNIAQRLATLYHNQAQVNLERRETGGTCVTLLVPRNNGVSGS